MGCVRESCAVVVECQTRLTKCFRELEDASEQHEKLAKSVNISFYSWEP